MAELMVNRDVKGYGDWMLGEEGNGVSGGENGVFDSLLKSGRLKYQIK